jgi:hypothetical protein
LDCDPEYEVSNKHPIEDPARLAAFTEAIASLDWVSTSFKTSFQILFRSLSDLVQAEIRYYYGRRCSSRRLSKICRFVAWSCGTAGMLIPLLQPVLGERAPEHLLSWGYVAFGAAGAALIFDTVFAGTQAHQRYTATQIELEKVYTVFALEWQARLLTLAKDNSTDSALELVAGAVAFSTEMHRAMGAETSSWQATVNKGLSELKGKISAGGGSAG